MSKSKKIRSAMVEWIDVHEDHVLITVDLPYAPIKYSLEQWESFGIGLGDQMPWVFISEDTNDSALYKY